MGNPLRGAFHVGAVVGLACLLASFFALRWASTAWVPRADLVMSSLVTLLGVPLGGLSAALGCVAGRWWWRRARRRRTMP